MVAKQHNTQTEGGYFCGVDGGGSNTRVLLANAAGEILGAGHAGSSNRNHHTHAEVKANLRGAFREALTGMPQGGDLRAVFLGMCGVATQADRWDIEAIVRSIPEIGAQPKIRVENDTYIGLSGGLSGRPGLVLIAGTGSACYGRNDKGQSSLCGGWGALVDDVGSGHWLGVRAMQAAVYAEDGRGAATSLRALVFDWLGIAEARQFLDRVHNQELSREDIAKLAPQVIAAAAAGDAVANGILRQAATELSALVYTCAAKLFADTPCELVYVGGVARSGPPFQTILSQTIVKQSPNIKVCEPELSPVAGAVLEALQAQGIALTPEILANIARGVHSKT